MVATPGLVLERGQLSGDPADAGLDRPRAARDEAVKEREGGELGHVLDLAGPSVRVGHGAVVGVCAEPDLVRWVLFGACQP